MRLRPLFFTSSVGYSSHSDSSKGTYGLTSSGPAALPSTAPHGPFTGKAGFSTTISSPERSPSFLSRALSSAFGCATAVGRSKQYGHKKAQKDTKRKGHAERAPRAGAHHSDLSVFLSLL